MKDSERETKAKPQRERERQRQREGGTHTKGDDTKGEEGRLQHKGMEVDLEVKIMERIRKVTNKRLSNCFIIHYLHVGEMKD